MDTAKGRAIREARKAKKLSQEALARDTCDRSTISRIERGEYDPPTDLWRRLANRLDLPASLPPDYTGTRLATAPHTAMREIRIALLSNRPNEAIQNASTTFWTLLEAGSVDVAVDFGLELLRVFKETDLYNDREWIPLISALLFHQVSRRAYHDVFRLGLVLQRLNGNVGRYDDVVTMGRILASMNPPLNIRVELLVGMGTAYLRAGKPADALFTFDQAVEGVSMSQSETVYARALHGLSAAHLSLQGWNNATHFAAQASLHYQAISHEFYWLARQNWANATLQDKKGTDVGLDVLRECAEHWIDEQRYAEFLSVAEDIFVWGRRYAPTLAEDTLNTALGEFS
ncbi:helix-turn-helix transcriptional regulator [Sulfobacillus harzensis]|uniref:Helix-turn-helix transcriptional regulator n=1 Tax=Sulfobacillus harzensis TaxID=2729629 RepID=A0A7Y0LAY8_9FIRM|nr:helix-turn-helix transcriptional regulator [Sulfobacillus harzensis]NMP25104.1 helix-turn-helix transcriptional regulator [Sulfobacillus harzensis]